MSCPCRRCPPQPSRRRAPHLRLRSRRRLDESNGRVKRILENLDLHRQARLLAVLPFRLGLVDVGIIGAEILVIGLIRLLLQLSPQVGDDGRRAR